MQFWMTGLAGLSTLSGDRSNSIVREALAVLSDLLWSETTQGTALLRGMRPLGVTAGIGGVLGSGERGETLMRSI